MVDLVGRDGGRGQEVGGVVGAGGEAGCVGGAVEGVEVWVEVRHVVRGGLSVRADQRRVPVYGEMLVLVDNQGALGGDLSGRGYRRPPSWYRLKAGARG